MMHTTRSLRTRRAVAGLATVLALSATACGGSEADDVAAVDTDTTATEDDAAEPSEADDTAADDTAADDTAEDDTAADDATESDDGAEAEAEDAADGDDGPESDDATDSDDELVATSGSATDDATSGDAAAPVTFERFQAHWDERMELIEPVSLRDIGESLWVGLGPAMPTSDEGVTRRAAVMPDGLMLTVFQDEQTGAVQRFSMLGLTNGRDEQVIPTVEQFYELFAAYQTLFLWALDAEPDQARIDEVATQLVGAINDEPVTIDGVHYTTQVVSSIATFSAELDGWSLSA